MQIQLNGEPRMMTGEGTVADLLRELEIRPDRVAVEINLEIVDRQEFDRRVLREGDRVEVISFIGGGVEGRGGGARLPRVLRSAHIFTHPPRRAKTCPFPGRMCSLREGARLGAPGVGG